MSAIVCLCTGNATRSVIAEVLLAGEFPDLALTSAGTLVIEGLPISWRTRAAFESIDVSPPFHRGRQADEAMLVAAPLVLAAAPEHVAWVRRLHPEIAPKTVTMKRLLRSLERWHDDTGLDAFLTADDFGQVTIEDWEEIVDPGGMEVDVYESCAAEIRELVDRLVVPFGRLVGAAVA